MTTQVEGRVDDINGIASQIIGNIELASPQMKKKSQIYRIPQKVREGNEKAYEPTLVSIGPYHRGKNHLQNMEFHKLRLLRQCIEQIEERQHTPMDVQMNRYIEALGELEDEARAFYSEVIPLEQSDFLEMLLLDGCFIIQFLHEWLKQDEGDHLFQAAWVMDAVVHDLVLFENQLPFIILVKLYDLTSNRPLPYLYRYVATLPIHHFILPPDQERKEQVSIFAHLNNHVSGKVLLDQKQLNDVEHLLELLYKLLFIEDTLLKKPQSLQIHAGGEEEAREKALQTDNKYSATDLSNSGIVFKRVERKNFYDIVLKNKTLEIPAIVITWRTDVMLRNLIAYEANESPYERKYVSDYVVFMDNLISSAKDVELLRLKGIILHYIGDDKAVSTIFRDLGRDTNASGNYYYVDILMGLNDHCQRKWNEWKTMFRRNYLNSPWALISVIAAVVLLILTALQTLYGALSYHKPIKM